MLFILCNTGIGPSAVGASRTMIACKHRPFYSEARFHRPGWKPEAIPSVDDHIIGCSVIP